MLVSAVTTYRNLDARSVTFTAATAGLSGQTLVAIAIAIGTLADIFYASMEDR